MWKVGMESGQRVQNAPRRPMALLGAAVMLLCVATLFLLTRGDTPNAKGLLRIANPCPVDHRAMIYDSTEFPGESRHLQASFVLRSGITTVRDVRIEDIDSSWTLHLRRGSGASIAYPLTRSPWYSRGLAVIPALNC